MITEILKIRAKQSFRVISEIGIFRAIFLLGLICFSLLALFAKLAESSYREIILGIFALTILSVHSKRKDKEFISIYAQQPYIIFLIEYFIISLPLMFALAYNKLWGEALIFLLFMVIVPFLNINAKKKSINSRVQKLIPDYNFEWKAGIRKNLIIFTGIWLIGIATSFFIASVPITIFILGVTVISFYEKPEPVQILLANELSARKFLTKKILNHLLIFAITIIPLILSFLIFNPQYYYIPLAEFVIFSILLVYTILLKYAFYRPDNISGATQIFSMIGIISIFIPVFLPLVLILSIKFLFQATNNLKFYLNDFN
ncbi:MAG: hypothetical protein B6D61_05980 [Bacteroidetes bacterium 4484_249]|nr:MAG: hypothetical protein B6D61_05980 [Bacteroidetes bacterium 4484_249]